MIWLLCLRPLLSISAPEGDRRHHQVLISTIDYNEFVGRIGVGKIDNGSLRVNQECVLVNHHDPDKFKKDQDR